MVFKTDIPLPAPWVGLFTALASKRYPDRRADMWYSEATDSRYGHQPTWSSLLKSMTVLEPYICQETQQLCFKPRMLHLPTEIQARFLQFLCRHSNIITDREIQSFVNKLRPYLEIDSVVLKHLIVLHRSIKSADTVNETISTPEKLITDYEYKGKAAVNVIPSDQIAKTGELTESRELMHDDNAIGLRDLVHDDDVVVIDLDSEDEEPNPKRQKLDNAIDASDEASCGGANSADRVNNNVDITSDNLHNNDEVAIDENYVALNGKNEPESINNIGSQSVATAEPEESSQNKTVIELNEEKEQAIGRLKEIWHSAGTTETYPATEMESLVSLTIEEMETAVQMLELTELSESGVLTACSHLVTVSEFISYRNCVCFLKSAMLGKVMALTQNASRVLVSAVTMVANGYPKQLIDSVIVPCVVGIFDLPQLDLVTRLLKDSFSEANQIYFMNNLIAGQELELNDSKIALIQTLLETLNIHNEIMVKILNLFEREATKLAKNLKFGKLLLALVNKHGKLLGGGNLIKFSIILDKHQTFVKKSIQITIKKLKS